MKLKINDYEIDSQKPIEEPPSQLEYRRRLPMRRRVFMRTWTLQLLALRLPKVTVCRINTMPPAALARAA